MSGGLNLARAGEAIGNAKRTMSPTRFRWFVVFLLFAITTVNYIDRAAMAALALSSMIIVLLFHHSDKEAHP